MIISILDHFPSIDDGELALRPLLDCVGDGVRDTTAETTTAGVEIVHEKPLPHEFLLRVRYGRRKSSGDRETEGGRGEITT